MIAKGQVGIKAWPVQTDEGGSHTGPGECHHTALQPGKGEGRSPRTQLCNIPDRRKRHAQEGSHPGWKQNQLVTDGAISVEICAT